MRVSACEGRGATQSGFAISHRSHPDQQHTSRSFRHASEMKNLIPRAAKVFHFYGSRKSALCGRIEGGDPSY